MPFGGRRRNNDPPVPPPVGEHGGKPVADSHYAIIAVDLGPISSTVGYPGIRETSFHPFDPVTAANLPGYAVCWPARGSEATAMQLFILSRYDVCAPRPETTRC